MPTAILHGSGANSQTQSHSQIGLGFEVEQQGQKQRPSEHERPALNADQQEELDRQLARFVQQSQCGTLDFKRFMRKVCVDFLPLQPPPSPTHTPQIIFNEAYDFMQCYLSCASRMDL